MDYTTANFFIGFFGDILLQLIVKVRGDIAGLAPYFKLHQPFESASIAGGLMFLVAYIYDKLGFKKSFINLFIYGGILDILWRNLNLMPTLEHTYYKALGPVVSFIWGGIPMVIYLLL